jgi:tRNA(fMet)-specific endonuclease VapC
MTSGSNPRPRRTLEPVARMVLDTSAYSRFRAGDSRVQELMAGAEIVFLPVTVLGELHGAFECGSRARENRVALAELLGEPWISVLPTSASVARQYGSIYAALRRAGTPIPANDMWIAAAAIDQGGSVVTFDTDFSKVPHLACIILEGIELGTEDD